MNKCIICGKPFSGQLVRVVGCGHVFHIRCLQIWASQCELESDPAVCLQVRCYKEITKVQIIDTENTVYDELDIDQFIRLDRSKYPIQVSVHIHFIFKS